MKRIRMFSIGRVIIEFFPGWKKIKQQRISFILGYLRIILWKISTAIHLYGFLNQSLGLILGNIFLIKITACVPLMTISIYLPHFNYLLGSSWSWSYGNWIYNYLCNWCVSPLTWVQSPFMARYTQYSIMWWRLSMTCIRPVVFSGYYGFLHQ